MGPNDRKAFAVNASDMLKNLAAEGFSRAEAVQIICAWLQGQRRD